MKKKLILILTIAALLFGLGACSKNNSGDDSEEIEIPEEVEGTGELIIKANKKMPTEIVYDPTGEKEVDLKAYFIVRYRRLKKEITDDMLDDGGFDITRVGTYTVTVSGFDPDQNVTKSDFVRLKVIEEDTTPPTIYPNPKNGFEFTAGHDIDKFYEERGFVFVDNVDGTVEFTSNEPFKGLDKVDPNKLGDYDVSVSVSDSAGNTTEIDFVLSVVDNEAPIIYAISNMSTKKGVPIDINSHIKCVDNYYPEEEIEFYYKVRTQEYDKVYSELLDIEGEISRLRNSGLSTEKQDQESKRLNEIKDEIQQKVDEIVEADRKYVDEVDFNQLGEHNIEVFAKDPSGNESSKTSPRTFKLIVTNSPSFGAIIGITNAIALGVLIIGIGVALAIVLPRMKSNTEQETNSKEENEE